MELLYAVDLVLIAKTEDLLLEKLRKWEKGMENEEYKYELVYAKFNLKNYEIIDA